jgi:hypothetical protein
MSGALAFDPYSFDDDTPPADNSGAAVANPTAVLCARCGAPSPPFSVIVNADLWQCAACLPGDLVDEVIDLTQRL